MTCPEETAKADYITPIVFRKEEYYDILAPFVLQLKQIISHAS